MPDRQNDGGGSVRLIQADARALPERHEQLPLPWWQAGPEHDPYAVQRHPSFGPAYARLLAMLPGKGEGRG